MILGRPSGGSAGRGWKVTRVKICGITCPEDALAAVRSGADALGFVFAESPRRVTPDRARAIIRRLPLLMTTVGVFVDAPTGLIEEVRSFCQLDAVQLSGGESEEMVARLDGRVIKAVKVADGLRPDPKAFLSTTLLLDAYSPQVKGGSGMTFDWRLAVEPARQREIILAGGLNPENVIQAIETVHPYAVDVSSGVESKPGRKDHDKLSCFIHRAKKVG